MDPTRRQVLRAGAGVVVGSDHPISWEEHPVDHVLNTLSLSGADRTEILGGNAQRLLNL